MRWMCYFDFFGRCSACTCLETITINDITIKAGRHFTLGHDVCDHHVYDVPFCPMGMDAREINKLVRDFKEDLREKECSR